MKMILRKNSCSWYNSRSGGHRTNRDMCSCWSVMNFWSHVWPIKGFCWSRQMSEFSYPWSTSFGFHYLWSRR